MTKRYLLLVGPVAAIGLTGCLASKGDVRLLQDELLATHAAIAHSDSVHQRQIDSLAAALAASTRAAAREDSALRLSIRQNQQATDSKLGDVTNKMRADRLAANDTVKALSDRVSQVQEFTKQNARGVSQAKAAVERVTAVVSAPVATPSDTSVHTAVAQPGPASLLEDGNAAILQGSCRTARRTFEDYLRLYPNSPDAALAQFSIAESFVSCAEGGNPAAADSVYSLVTAKYPKSDYAAIALYKQGEMQAKNNKPDSARALFQRVVCEYPKVDVAGLAAGKSGVVKSCK